MKSICAAMHFFKQFVLAVLPERTVSHECYFSHGNSFYMLFRFLTGKGVKNGHVSDELLPVMGRTLGIMHMASMESTLNIISQSFYSEKTHYLKNSCEDRLTRLERRLELGEFTPKARGGMALVHKLTREKQAMARGAERSFHGLRLPNNTLIHGDFVPANLVFNDGAEVLGVIDFIRSDNSPRVLELLRMIDFSCFYRRYRREYFERARVILRNYLKVCPLIPEELEKGVEGYYLGQIMDTWREEDFLDHPEPLALEYLDRDLRRLFFFSNFRSELLNTLFDELR